MKLTPTQIQAIETAILTTRARANDDSKLSMFSLVYHPPEIYGESKLPSWGCSLWEGGNWVMGEDMERVVIRAGEQTLEEAMGPPEQL